MDAAVAALIGCVVVATKQMYFLVCRLQGRPDFLTILQSVRAFPIAVIAIEDRMMEENQEGQRALMDFLDQPVQLLIVQKRFAGVTDEQGCLLTVVETPCMFS
ncbi:hypothetical protein [Sphaerochaeta sp. UBA5836]|uniref:hypothetical protein n=1 Tax=Sphaerochaeta sp. UBA5836 TaxID=1947474 RepID=UPI0025ECC07C|nr:hypothetical protein [Sphaerochaeta sp. UBA5836]